MDKNTQEILKAIVTNSCIGIEAVVNTDKSLTDIEKKFFVYEVEAARKHADDGKLKEAMRRVQNAFESMLHCLNDKS